MNDRKQEWRFQDGYWQGPDWPLSILYWALPVVMVALALALTVLVGVSVVARF
jgi:hypothetical protein